MATTELDLPAAGSATHAASVCPLDCPDRCTLDVTVENGKVTRLAGTNDNPITANFLCSKVSRGFVDRMYGPERVMHPMRRTGAKGSGTFAPISWGEAIDEITTRLLEARAKHGGSSILPFYYGGSNGLLTQSSTDLRYFRFLGASHLDRTVCAAPATAAGQALYGRMPVTDIADAELADTILVWGGNPAASNIHLLPYLKRARKRGAKVVLVDPRRTMDDVDLHLPVFPGTDVVLALGVVGELERIGAVDRAFLAEHTTGWEKLLAEAAKRPLSKVAEICRVPEADIRTAVRWYAEADPALVRCGWGLERNRNGEASVASVIAIPAVAGKFGKPGGGYMASASGSYRMNDETAIGLPPNDAPTVNMNRLGRVLLGEEKPHVAALFVYNCNPVVSVPDQERIERGLRREDLFTVVFDQVMTDSAAFADIVLPATTFLEHRELTKSYGTYGVALAPAAVPPVGESRPNEVVFRDLGLAAAERLGNGRELFDRSDAEVLANVYAGLGASMARRPEASELASAGWIPMDFPGPRPVAFRTTFPFTEDRKAHLWPDRWGAEPYGFRELAENPSAPLALISPSTGETINSTFGERNLPVAVVSINTADAKARGIADGDDVRVFNEMSSVECRAEVTEAIRPGVVMLPKGLWKRASRNGRVAAALVPDACTEISGGACWNDARVDVRKA